MNYDDIIRHYGGLTRTAKALDRRITTVSGWRHGVPFGVQCEIELRTDGALRVEGIERPAKAPEQSRIDAAQGQATLPSPNARNLSLAELIARGIPIKTA